MIFLKDRTFLRMSLHLVTLEGGNRQNLPKSLKAVTNLKYPFGFFIRKLGDTCLATKPTASGGTRTPFYPSAERGIVTIMSDVCLSVNISSEKRFFGIGKG